MIRLLQKKSWAILAALISVFLWGSAFPVLKLAYESFGILPGDSIPKLQFSGLRFFIAGVMIVLLGKRLAGPTFLPKENHFTFVLLIGLVGVTIQYSFSSIGIGNTTGMKSSIIQSSNAFMILLAATLLLRIEKLRISHVVSMLLGFGGVLVANLTKQFDLSFQVMGEGFMVISAVSAAISTLMIKQYRREIHPFFLAGWHMILGSIPMIIIGYVLAEPIRFSPLSVFYFMLSVGISSISFMLWYTIIQIHSVSEMSLYLMFIPVFGSSLSALLLGEDFGWNIVLALVLVALGMMVQQLPNRRPKLPRETS